MKDEKLKKILAILSEIAEKHVTIGVPIRQTSLFDTQGADPGHNAPLSTIKRGSSLPLTLALFFEALRTSSVVK